MKVSFVDLQAQWAEIETPARAAIDRVLASCAFAGGPEVEAFEQDFAAYCGTSEAVGVGSGTAALEIVLRALGVTPHDEIILPANTFIATAEAVALAGAKPVLVDVDPHTANMDPEKFADAITSHTRAVIPVHLFGQPAHMTDIAAIAKERGLFILEDASQAQGATWEGRRTGSLGHAAAFSFYPSKNLGACGEAGAVTTDNPELAERVRMIRDHGSQRKYHHELLGMNERMDGLQGALLAVKLRYLDEWNDRRRERADQYRQLLADHDISTITELPQAHGVEHLFVVRLPESQRDAVAEALKERGIGTGVHYPLPIHLQPAFAELPYHEGAFPVSEQLAREMLSLPMHPYLTSDEVSYVVQSLVEVIANPVV